VALQGASLCVDPNSAPIDGNLILIFPFELQFFSWNLYTSVSVDGVLAGLGKCHRIVTKMELGNCARVDNTSFSFYETSSFLSS